MALVKCWQSQPKSTKTYSPRDDHAYSVANIPLQQHNAHFPKEDPAHSVACIQLQQHNAHFRREDSAHSVADIQLQQQNAHFQREDPAHSVACIPLQQHNAHVEQSFRSRRNICAAVFCAHFPVYSKAIQYTVCLYSLIHTTRASSPQI